MNKAPMLRKMFACLAIFGVASAAPAQEARYTILDLGALGEATAFSSAGGINEAGQITGAAGTSIQGIDMHPFRWQPSSGMQDLGTLGGTYGAGFDINEAGQVVGYYIDASSTSRGFLWDAAHGMQDLGTLSAGAYSFATGINDAGLVVGASNNHTFLWDAANGMQDLGTFGGNGSGGGAINNAGLVAGTAATHFSRFRAVGITESHGFIWDSASNTTTVLTPLPGRTDTKVAGINEAGQVVGTSGTVVAFAGGQGYYYQYVADEAFLWQDGVMTGLGKLPGASVSTVSAINNVGQVVGMSGGRLFLWDDGVLTELNSLIDPSLGWSLISVSDINDRGHIVGSGEHHGVWRAFLLSPDAAPPMRAGDYDGDLDVDGGDFLAWQRGLGSSVMPSGSGADGDDSGAVDAGDLTVWQDNFGATPGSRSSIAKLEASVPEPTSIVLAGVGLAAARMLSLNRRGGAAIRRRESASRFASTTLRAPAVETAIIEWSWDHYPLAWEKVR